jgi:replication factor C subunit 1
LFAILSCVGGQAYNPLDQKVIQLMDDYYITKEDWDSMLELGYQEKLGQIETKIKTSFTKK